MNMQVCVIFLTSIIKTCSVSCLSLVRERSGKSQGLSSQVEVLPPALLYVHYPALKITAGQRSLAVVTAFVTAERLR